MTAGLLDATRLGVVVKIVVVFCIALSLSLISVAVVDVVSRHWCWLVVAVVVDGVDFVVVIAVALVVVAVSLVVVASSSV